MVHIKKNLKKKTHVNHVRKETISNTENIFIYIVLFNFDFILDLLL